MTLMKKMATTLAALFLSVSAAQSETTIDALVEASRTIAIKLEQGRYAAFGAEHYAATGNVIDYSAVIPEQHLITEADVSAYNDAVTNVQQALYFTTKMALEEKAAQSMVKVSDAVDSLVIASVQLSVVEEVAERAETAQETDDVTEQLAVQDYVETNDVQIQQSTVDDFNQSLEAIAVNSRQAGAFLAASKSEQLTSISDEHAQEYGNSMAEASISYSATNDVLSMQWASNTGHIEFHEWLSGSMVDAASVLSTGEEIYLDQHGYMFQ